MKLDFADDISKVICQMGCCNSKFLTTWRELLDKLILPGLCSEIINNLSELQSALNLFRCPMRNESGMFIPVASELIFLHHKNYNLRYCSPCWQFSAETSKTEYASKQKWLNAGNSLFSITGSTAVAIDGPKILLHPREGTPCSSRKKDWRSLL